ncbi:PaREP1 family protein [Candidatus Bathyarchaeota archaeon]|nr:PaREP1 family protein [Candidatus Bathyarchaeota archaeon]MBS7614062.1 PaREP1 family protein [Candidatus Bathyarchaeota archaeon]
MELILPKRIEERLRKECEKTGITAEELAFEALCRGLNEKINPSERAEAYMRLSEKYLVDAEDFLLKGDHAQASEKLWGSAALMVKAVAAIRGISILSHGELFSFVRKIGEEQNESEFRRLFSVANTLHQNFYENWLHEDVIKEYYEDIKQFIVKLKKLIN